MSKFRNRLSMLVGPKRGDKAGEATATASSKNNAEGNSKSATTLPQHHKQTNATSREGGEASSDESDAHNAIDYRPSARALTGPNQNLRQLYPNIEPFERGALKVDHHELYWEQSGKKDGYPLVFLHGGPGGGCSADDRRWFDPSHYRIIIFDQRGSGKSTPSANLDKNSTWDLVSDIEKLREEFGFKKWHVFGGSWGSTLALAYAQTHADRVSALILRGIFTLRRSELLFFYQDGASHLFPEQFEPYREFIPEEERDDMIAAYYKRLTSQDEKLRLEAAKRWSTWENATSKLYIDQQHVKRGEDEKWALAFARIESHFFQNRGWMQDGQLLSKEGIDKIRHIPTVIVQGRYDAVCPAKTAFDLHKQWPEAEFHLVPDAGHSAKEPGIMDHLIKGTDKLRSVK